MDENTTNNPGPTNPQSNQTDKPEEKYLTDKTMPEDLAQSWRRTKCSVCGYVHEGMKPLKKCPKCGNTDPDKFVEAD